MLLGELHFVSMEMHIFGKNTVASACWTVQLLCTMTYEVPGISATLSLAAAMFVSEGSLRSRVICFKSTTEQVLTNFFSFFYSWWIWNIYSKENGTHFTDCSNNFDSIVQQKRQVVESHSSMCTYSCLSPIDLSKPSINLSNPINQNSDLFAFCTLIPRPFSCKQEQKMKYWREIL